MVADKPKVACDKARLYFYDFLQQPQETNICQEAWDHIRQCPNCRAELARLNNELNLETPNSVDTSRMARYLGLHFAYLKRPVNCDAVKIFFPMMAMEQVKLSIPTPISVHIHHCPQCASDMNALRSLNLTSSQLRQVAEAFSSGADPDMLDRDTFTPEQIEMITEIALRPDSGIHTTFEVIADKPALSLDNPEDIYAAWPIKVTIKKPTVVPLPTSKIGFGKHLFVGSQRRVLRPAMRRLAVPLALAAMLMIACGVFFWQVSPAKALDLKEIYQSFQQMEGVHLAKYQRNHNRPLQEIWLSHITDQYLIKDTNTTILWNLAQGNKKIKIAEERTINTVDISPKDAANIRQALHSMGILPFYEWTQVPAQAIWKKVDSIAGAESSDVEIYELTWKTYDAKTNGELQCYKWRCYWDVRRKLLVKAENYLMDLLRDDFVLDNYSLIYSVSDQEFQMRLKAEGLSQGEH